MFGSIDVKLEPAMTGTNCIEWTSHTEKKNRPKKGWKNTPKGGIYLGVYLQNTIFTGNIFKG